MDYTHVDIETYAPFPTLRLRLPRSTSYASIAPLLAPLCPVDQQSLCLFSGRSLPDGDLDADYIHLRLGVRLPGGKGGFGSQLRAAGGRMSSKRTENKDSCRTLDGRRLSTVKEAERLSQYIASAPQREQAKKDEAKRKLKELQDQIERMEADSAPTGANKRRFDDNDFVEENQQLVDGVKSAMAAAMAKRKKKKLASTEPLASTSASTKVDEAAAPAVAATA